MYPPTPTQTMRVIARHRPAMATTLPDLRGSFFVYLYTFARNASEKCHLVPLASTGKTGLHAGHFELQVLLQREVRKNAISRTRARRPGWHHWPKLPHQGTLIVHHVRMDGDGHALDVELRAMSGPSTRFKPRKPRLADYSLTR